MRNTLMSDESISLEYMIMKKNLFYMFLVLGVVASVAYARTDRAHVFTFAGHPLEGYADQIVVEELNMAPQGAESTGLNLFD